MKLLAGRGIPEANRLIGSTAGCDLTSILIKSHELHGMRVSRQHSHRLPSRSVPDLRVVLRTSGKKSSVGTISNGQQQSTLTLDLVNFLASIEVPDFCKSITAN